ncbi:MAG: hypothetical protein J5802_01630 [Butyrivibrio sp.]|nr:hypothetical protein [Butyrivibrio sp.]
MDAQIRNVPIQMAEKIKDRWQANEDKPLGLGWYKILIYVQLPGMMISALVAILFSFSTNGLGSALYFDVLANISLVAFVFFVHYGLRKKCLSAPKYLLLVYLFEIVLSVFRCVMYTKNFGDIKDEYITIAVYTALIVFNYFYFRNRKQIFNREDANHRYLCAISCITVITCILMYPVVGHISFHDSEETKSACLKSMPKEATDKTITVNNKNRVIPKIVPTSSNGPSEAENRENTVDPQEYLFPNYNGDTYVSNALGIEFDLPEDMRYLSVEEVARNDGAKADNFEAKLAKDLAAGELRTEMGAGVVSENNYGQVLVRLKYFGIENEQLIESIPLMAAMELADENVEERLREHYGAKDVEIKEVSPSFCGRTCKGVSIKLGYENGDNLFINQTVFINNGYVGYVVVLGPSDESCNKYLECFHNTEGK